MRNSFGPSLEFSNELHQGKYRSPGESFEEFTYRVCSALKDDDDHYHYCVDMIGNQRALPGGRIQSAMGAARQVTAYNCFVSGTIDDSMDGIMLKAWEAATTMRFGGGIGYDFSTLRPDRSLIKSLQSFSSGPLSFMNIFDATCGTIASAGHRRGAQMGMMRIDHPDIEDFIQSKMNHYRFKNFNISVAVTEEFMQSLVSGSKQFHLRFNGEVVKTVDPRYLYERLMRATWDWADPGVVFIDTINDWNNLWYCEKIAATNPCGEQPLPPYGACLLGSLNLVKYVEEDAFGVKSFDYELFEKDARAFTRMLNNVVDRTIYPLDQQKAEALSKRRMGIGVTGEANAIEAMGDYYATDGYMRIKEKINRTLRDACYSESIEIAKERGAFPLFDVNKYINGKFIATLPDNMIEDISRHGIANSHLLSYAPTGTISMCADNVSGSTEPVFSLKQVREINMPDGKRIVNFDDYGWRKFGTHGRTADKVTAKEHVAVQALSQRYVDSAVSKTCNVSPDMPWDDFKQIYINAWELGCKGITTFNSGGKRMAILKSEDGENQTISDGTACYVAEDGTRLCE